MKILRRNRTSRVVIATALFLVVSFNSPATLPSELEDQPEPPSPEEIYVLEELAEWVLGESLSKEFSVFSEADMVVAVQSRPRSFELFRKYGEASSRWALVRSMPYGDLIRSTAMRYKVDSLLLASMVEAESGFNPYAISPQGALGLMQIMPETAQPYSVDDLLEPAVNIDLGARYMARLLREFDGDVALALAGYNAGPGNVKRFGGMPPFRETRDYVDRVLSRYVDYHRDIWQTSGDPDFLF
jgi:soluble lytic murein transglycosylase-like protein